VRTSGDAVIHRGLEDVAALGAEIAARYGGADLTPELAAAMRAQAAKRVGLQFAERSPVTSSNTATTLARA
jgi:hypothetical protein